jgi:hypothetical protein
MSAVDALSAPIAVFGDLEVDVWGLLIGGETPQLAVAGLTSADVEMRTLDLDLEDSEIWTLTAPGCALRVERAGAAATTTAGGDQGLEPCRVSGAVTVDGVERELDVGGVRSDGFTLEGRDSLRLFASWFPAGHEVALLAVRPKGAKGHDRDSVGVVARGEEHPLVVDPRLSTTYDHGGQPRRVGVELWLGDDEEGELWPRRVAGTATGSRVDRSGVSAYAFECKSRGETGAGIYVLAHRD